MNNDFDKLSAEYREIQALIEASRRSRKLRFRFADVLEKQFHQHFSRLAANSVKSAYVFLCIPLLLTLHLGIVGVSFTELADSLWSALRSLFFFRPGFHGTQGVYVVHIVVACCLLVLWPLHQRAFFRQHFQFNLALSSAVILAGITIALAMTTDERYLFSQQLELVATYLFVFVFLRMQVVYLLINQILTLLLVGFIVFSLNLQPDWNALSALLSSMILFGFIFAWLRERHERDNFLQLIDIENQKQQFELLHKQIEKENHLKADLSRFYAVMSGEKNLQRLGEKIVSFLVPEVGAQLGSLYLLKGENLTLIAHHGVAHIASLRQEIPLGEGLLGQCAIEKQILYLKESPENFQVIQSGLGKIEHPALTLIPFMFDDELIAIMEIASIQPLENEAMAFLEAANRSISTALKAVAAKSGFMQ